MEQRCEKGCEILKGHKFCGKCGLPPNAPDEVQKCTAGCETNLLKGVKFCHDCGEKQADGDNEFQASLDVLKSFAAAKASLLDSDLVLTPVDEASAVAASDPAAILKAAGAQAPVTEADGKVTFDAMPIVLEVLKSTNVLGLQQKSFANDLLKALNLFGERIGERMTALMKGQIASSQKMLALEEQLTAVAGGSRANGPKAAQVLKGATPVAKGAERADLHGQELLLKAQVVPVDKGGLNSTEVAVLQDFTDAGGGLPELIKSGRGLLAQRVQQVIAQATH